MSAFSALSLGTMEAAAALLLLDSDDIDNIVKEELHKLKAKLKAAEEQKEALNSSAFRITTEDKDTFFKNENKKLHQRKSLSPSKARKKKYGYWLKAGSKGRTPVFAENFLPNLSSHDCKTHFGLTPSQIEKLSRLIQPYYGHNDKQKNLESFVLVGLSNLASQKSCREIGIQMSRSKSHVCIWSQKFNSILADNFTYLIKWPKENIDSIERKFRAICGFPGVVGAFGACHIPLKYASKSSDLCFKNNKGFYSLVLSTTCDHNMCFTSLSIDTPANFQSTNGMSSKTIKDLMTNPDSLIQQDAHILAGSGFPVCNQILTPFVKGEGADLTEEQTAYNGRLEETRRVILRAFRLLRSRFRRLRVIDVADFSRAAAAVVAACVLHNLALEDDVALEDDDGTLEEEGEEEEENVLEVDWSEEPACPKRDAIARSFLESTTAHL